MPEYTFTYPNYGTPDGQPHLTAHSGQTCTILCELGDKDRNPEVGRMFTVIFDDGVTGTAYFDELSPEPPPLYTLTVHEPEYEMGEAFSASVVLNLVPVAGIVIMADGTAKLITWPDGEQNVTAELPTNYYK